MKSRYWLSCVRRGGPLRTSLGYRPPIGCNFDSDVGQDLSGRRSDLFTGIIDPSEGRESRLGTVGCVCEIGVFSPMSCEVELFYDHSGIKPTF